MLLFAVYQKSHYFPSSFSPKASKKRPYVLVGAFVVGMLLTPPDVFSQTLLAIPMYCLFEIGVFFSRFYVGKGRNREEENDAEAESEKTEE